MRERSRLVRALACIAALASTALLASLGACTELHERADMPRPPYCVQGGNAPVESSQEDYGATYTKGLERGPAAAVPDSRIVVAPDAGDCVPPPWWEPSSESTPRSTAR